MPDGTLYVVSTPIGNLEDITLRAISTLRQSSLIAAEDTRQTKKLLNHFNITIPMLSYFDHNKSKQIPKIINELQTGSAVSLVSDAGTPGISDPAYRLIRAAIEQNIQVISIPGPSALLAALVPSGLPTDRFIFEGFLPHKKGRKKILEHLSKFDGTIVFFENPKRLKRTLNDIINHIGDRPCVIARELTKIHEEFIRGTVKDIMLDIEKIKLKGEMVILIGKKDNNVYF